MIDRHLTNLVIGRIEKGIYQGIDKDQLVDRIIDHLKLSFIAEKPPSHVFAQVALMATEEETEYF